MYHFTLELASFAPPKVEQEILFRALEGRPEEIDRFLGVLACALSPTDYFSPSNLRCLIGLRGFLTIARAKMRRPQAGTLPSASSKHERATATAT